MVETKEIAQYLVNGGVVAIPTDTVYGLAADLHSTEGIASIYKLKKREPEKSLIIFLPDIEIIHRIPVVLNDRAQRLMNQFWPGDLTVVLQLTETALANPFWRLRAAQDGSIALRIPNHLDVRELMRKYKLCLMTTSANLSGENPCRTEEEIYQQFGDDFMVLEGANGMSHVASTIVDCRESTFKVLRKGALSDKPEFIQFMEVE